MSLFLSLCLSCSVCLFGLSLVCLWSVCPSVRLSPLSPLCLCFLSPAPPAPPIHHSVPPLFYSASHLPSLCASPHIHSVSPPRLAGYISNIHPPHPQPQFHIISPSIPLLSSRTPSPINPPPHPSALTHIHPATVRPSIHTPLCLYIHIAHHIHHIHTYITHIIHTHYAHIPHSCGCRTRGNALALSISFYFYRSI